MHPRRCKPAKDSNHCGEDTRFHQKLFCSIRTIDHSNQETKHDASANLKLAPRSESSTIGERQKRPVTGDELLALARSTATRVGWRYLKPRRTSALPLAREICRENRYWLSVHLQWTVQDERWCSPPRDPQPQNLSAYDQRKPADPMPCLLPSSG